MKLVFCHEDDVDNKEKSASMVSKARSLNICCICFCVSVFLVTTSKSSNRPLTKYYPIFWYIVSLLTKIDNLRRQPQK